MINEAHGRASAVMAGGALGALLRFAVGQALPHSGDGFPIATFVVNITGAFGLGVAGVMLIERLAPGRYLRHFIAIGFFGAYTTFSTMALEGVRLLEARRFAVAITYWVLSLTMGQLSGALGMRLGRFEPPKTGGRPDEVRG